MPLTPSPPERLEIALKSVCQRAFPAWPGQAIANLARISDGWECDVYRFDLDAEANGAPIRSELILRLYQGNGAGRKARDEFKVLQLLARAGYPVPRVDVLAVDDSPLDQPLVIMERIDGQILGQLIEHAAEAEREPLLRRFCQLLARLHQLDWRPFVPDPGQYRAADAVPRWLDQTEALARQLNVHEFEPPFLWLRERATRVQTGQLALAHWDFHPWNVLVRPDGAAFMIDWTGVEITDSRFDLTWTLLIVQSTLGSAARDVVLAEYERSIGHPTADLDFFEVAASLRRTASIYISLTAGADKLGMRPGAEAQMKTDSTHFITAYALLRERTGLTIPAVDNLLSG